jgi:flagellar hook-basal body complex protein FliE
MDIRSTQAATGYISARPAVDPAADSITTRVGAAVQDFAATFQQGEATAMAAMQGKADPHALVQALAQAELAVEAAVTVRDKVVEAYQEILRMPV